MRFLVARTMDAAHSCAALDFQWRRIGKDIYLDDNDVEVKIIPDGANLYGYPHRSIIYLGHEWYKRRDAYTLRQLIVEERFVSPSVTFS